MQNETPHSYTSRPVLHMYKKKWIISSRGALARLSWTIKLFYFLVFLIFASTCFIYFKLLPIVRPKTLAYSTKAIIPRLRTTLENGFLIIVNWKSNSLHLRFETEVCFALSILLIYSNWIVLQPLFGITSVFSIRSIIDIFPHPEIIS